MPLRVLCLALWVGLLDLWLARHFHSGIGLKELSALAGIPLGSLFSAGVLDYLLGKQWAETQKQELREKIRIFFRNHVRWRVIVFVYIATVAVTATYTTVSIDAVADGERAFVLSSVNFPDKKVSGKTLKDSVTDLHVWINPFAAQYQLSVTGFLPAFIDVKPFIGSLIVPGRDLTPVPTVLLRPYFEGSRALRGGGVLELYKKTVNGFHELDDKGRGDSAWFIGPRRKQPVELQSSWQIELTALGMDAQLRASLLQRWLAPKAIATNELLAVDDTLCALIANVDGTADVAGAIVQITRDPYIDLPLRDFTNGSTNPDRGATGAEQCAELESSPG